MSCFGIRWGKQWPVLKRGVLQGEGEYDEVFKGIDSKRVPSCWGLFGLLVGVCCSFQRTGLATPSIPVHLPTLKLGGCLCPEASGAATAVRSSFTAARLTALHLRVRGFGPPGRRRRPA